MPHWKTNSILYRLQFSTVCLLLCTGLVTSKLTLEEKKLILKKHNALRQRIMQCGLPGQPPVQGYLHDLVWHEGLASKAAERANKCVTQAQPNKQNSGSSFSSIGQILIGNKGISHAIDVWINQYKKYDFATNSCKGSTCLGYLQMVRESTKYVGCAVHECTSNPHYKSKKVIVCNYGPNEYVAGQRPYRRGSKVNCRISSTVVKSVLITKEQRVRILKEHNELRQHLLQCNVSRQPPVKGKLSALMWHDGLAKKAAEWAKHCPVERDKPKRRRIFHFEVVGQNVANSLNLTSALKLWISEARYYHHASNRCKGSSCTNYKQMVWDSTTHIGCGMADCRSKLGYSHGLTIVCNYGRSGNVNTRRPYVAGTKADCHVVSNVNLTKPKTRETSLSSTRRVAVPLRPNRSTGLYWTTNLPGSATLHVSRTSNKPLTHPTTMAPAKFGPILFKNESLVLLTKAQMTQNSSETRFPKALRIPGKPASYTTFRSPTTTKPFTVATKSVDPSSKNSIPTSSPVSKHLITSTTYSSDYVEQSTRQSISTTRRYKYTRHNTASAFSTEHYLLIPLTYVVLFFT